MTTTVTATFDGKVLIPEGQVDLPKGTVLRLRVELDAEKHEGSLGDLEACGLWADRTDLGDTTTEARLLRRRVEQREDHSR